MAKEKAWKGYYKPYLAEAKRQHVDAVEFLEGGWGYSGEKAELVRPFVSQDSIALEIGCGIGRVSRFVAPYCEHLFCTDVLGEGLREAERTLAPHANVSFHKTTGYDLNGFETNSVDCVYSFSTFFHFDFELVVHYFHEIERVLRPKGVGILQFKQCLSDADITQLLEKIESVGGIESYESTIDKWRYVSEEMLVALCDYHELKVLDSDVTKFTFRTGDQSTRGAAGSP